MIILSIESSCDETAVAIVKDGSQILSNIVVSQIDTFVAYGGVIPEIAARSHLEAILPALHQAFQDANLLTQNAAEADWSQIDAIAVTHTPGLLGSLLIGTLTARTLAILHNKPLYPVHHLKSHIYAAWLSSPKKITFPVLALIVSGGHTQIVHMSSHNSFEIIGTTRDDAVGECYDKVAKILGLPYPGGPSIAQAANGEISQAQSGPTALTKSQKPITTHPGDPNKYPLPIPQIAELDFSFSGLKTAVLRAVQKELNLPISFPSHQLAFKLSPQQIADFAASFQHTATKILLKKLQSALQNHPANSLVIAGGVSANQDLRAEANKLFPSSPSLFFPEPKFSGDNAAMVGTAAFYEIQSGVQPTDPLKLNISPRSAIS